MLAEQDPDGAFLELHGLIAATGLSDGVISQ
jgi:hypothetical protein